MFYCKPCGIKEKLPTHDFMRLDYGRCELCEKHTDCFDVPNSQLQDNATEPEEENMPKEEKYYVIRVSSNGPHLYEYTRDEMLEELEQDEGAMMRNDEAPVLHNLPGRLSDWDLMSNGGTIIIRGKIVVPQERTRVTEYEID